MSDALKTLAARTFDLFVIGGGIVGAGVAREAALRGLSVALVDQYDFAFGTSSRSSRLLHGGIRYLAQGRVGLVKEASREKHVLQRIAPHLVDPLPFLFPTYKGTPWPRWKLSVGVKLYDFLCGEGNLGKSRTFSRDETIKHLGAAVPAENGLTGAVRYYDALTNDARLVLDTLRSAAKHGAALANYTRFLGADRKGGLWTCRVAANDGLSNEECAVTARAVVCAAGPWAQGLGANKLQLRLTKGIHLVVDRAKLPVPDAIVMSEGSRILFVIPWGERVILGTTDTDFEARAEAGKDPLANLRADSADTEYVLKITNAAFPQARLTEQDVISSWAGLRPLIADPNGSPSDISRSHEIKVSAPGWIEVAGGKLTTYRVMAEETVDRLFSVINSPFKKAGASSIEPLLPRAETDGVSAIVPPPFSREVVEHYCKNEWARTLNDVMIRRGGWHYYHRDREAIAAQAANWMAEILNWDAARHATELAEYGKNG